METTFMLKPLLDAAGWALLHSLWQGALVAGLYACFAALVPRRAADVRYAGGVAALLALLALPALTAGLSVRAPRGLFARESARPESAWSDSGAASARVPRAGKEPAARMLDGSPPVSVAAATWRESAEERLTALLPWLVCAWLCGVLLLASRMAGAWLLVLRLKRSAEPVPHGFEELLARVSGRLRVRRAVRLCRSALVEVPTVVGHLRPFILIPASALFGLTPRQLEAVLAHELAHVRRYDYAVNLLQTAVETLLFYHPAAWWLSGRVRAEREHACDDAAVEATGGDALGYARALAALEQLRAGAHAPAALALAANGGSLMQRIQRLVNADTRTQTRRPFAALALVLTLLCGALFAQRALTPAEARSAGAAAATTPTTAAPRREVAVTFVNYPGNIYDAGRLANKSRKLLRSLAAQGVQAVAFVNEAQFYKDDGQPNEARVQALRDWLDAGHELGNETAHHTNLFKASPEEFEADVVRGEQLIKQLSSERSRKVRYFSYPYLNTGPNPEVRGRVERFLKERGYQIHPVTIDNADWVFNNAYMEALRREDEAAAAAIRADYVPYMERMFEFYEGYSREVVGREFPQVLMLTGGALNADCFDDLAAMLKRRSYTFVTMEQALRDKAYSLPDAYTGPHGDSWLARWAVTRGLEEKDVEETNLPDSMQRHLAELQKRWTAPGAGKK